MDRAARPPWRRPYPDPAAESAQRVRAVSDTTLEFRVAIREAIVEEMERDESVVLFGEDVAAEQGGVFAVTPGIQERFGAERVFDTPISELAISGAAFGAAVPVCARSSRSCSATSWGCRWTRSSTSRPSTGTCRRAAQRAARRPLGGRRRRALRRDPLADARHLVPGDTGAEDRVPVLAGRGQGPAQGRDPRRQPGDLPRAQAALLGQGAGPGARAARCSSSAGRGSRDPAAT